MISAPQPELTRLASAGRAPWWLLAAAWAAVAFWAPGDVHAGALVADPTLSLIESGGDHACASLPDDEFEMSAVQQVRPSPWPESPHEPRPAASLDGLAKLGSSGTSGGSSISITLQFAIAVWPVQAIVVDNGGTIAAMHPLAPAEPEGLGLLRPPKCA